MSDKILFVDDDALILDMWERTLERQFLLETALGPQEALAKIETSGPFAVVISDMQMPVMDGLTLLQRVRAVSPDSVRIILTGNADVRTAIAAVNEGDIFRFLEKPCPDDVLSKVLVTALDQYRLLRAEKDLLEKTLHGSIKVLTEVLGLVNPEAFSTASRITLYVKHITGFYGFRNPWQFEMAAMLSQLGCVVLPPDTLEAVRQGRRLNKDQESRFAAHPAIARELLRNIPRLEAIAEMVARQQDPCPNPPVPLGERDATTIGAQMLKVCIRFERLIRTGMGHVAAIQSLLAAPREYDAELTAALSRLPTEVLPCDTREVSVDELTCRMVLDDDLRTKEGTLLVTRGIEITETILIRIQNFQSRGSVAGSIRVLVPTSVRRWEAEGSGADSLKDKYGLQ